MGLCDTVVRSSRFRWSHPPTNEFVARTQRCPSEPEAGAKAHSNGEQPGVAHQPSDRAIGSGWSMLNSGNPDWAVVGADTHSIFLFLHSQNRSLQQTPPQDTADTPAAAAIDDGRALSRSNSSCSAAVNTLENTISTIPSAAAVLC